MRLILVLAVALPVALATPPVAAQNVHERMVSACDMILTRTVRAVGNAMLYPAHAALYLNYKLFLWQVAEIERNPNGLLAKVAAFETRLRVGEHEALLRTLDFQHGVYEVVSAVASALATTFRQTPARVSHNLLALRRQVYMDHFGRQALSEAPDVASNEHTDQARFEIETWSYVVSAPVILFRAGQRLPKLYRTGTTVTLAKGLVIGHVARPLNTSSSTM